MMQPGPTVPAVSVNDVHYEHIARGFLPEFCASVAGSLVSLGVIDLGDIQEKSYDAIYSVCFSALLRLEDFGGVAVGSERYFLHCAFARKPTAPAELILSSRRTFLHGGLDDEVLMAAVEKLRSREPTGSSAGTSARRRGRKG